MRFPLAVAVVVSISFGGFAQQNNSKVRPSAPETALKSSALPDKMPATSTATNANQLKAIEHQTAQTAAAPSPAKKTPIKAFALKPLKDKPNPPINFGGTSGGKTLGTTSHGSGTYSGRLKQKGGGGQQ
jgi:hypothetical protein